MIHILGSTLDTVDHENNAPFAAFTAFSTSVLDEAGKVQTTSPVDGL